MRTGSPPNQIAYTSQISTEGVHSTSYAHPEPKQSQGPLFSVDCLRQLAQTIYSKYNTDNQPQLGLASAQKILKDVYEGKTKSPNMEQSLYSAFLESADRNHDGR